MLRNSTQLAQCALPYPIAPPPLEGPPLEGGLEGPPWRRGGSLFVASPMVRGREGIDLAS